MEGRKHKDKLCPYVVNSTNETKVLKDIMHADFLKEIKK